MIGSILYMLDINDKRLESDVTFTWTFPMDTCRQEGLSVLGSLPELIAKDGRLYLEQDVGRARCNYFLIILWKLRVT